MVKLPITSASCLIPCRRELRLQDVVFAVLLMVSFGQEPFQRVCITSLAGGRVGARAPLPVLPNGALAFNLPCAGNDLAPAFAYPVPRCEATAVICLCSLG